MQSPMRTLIAVLALCLCLPAFAGESQYLLGVKGLACPFCAYGIEKHLNKLEGVAAIEVDIASGNVLVTMEDGAALSRSQAESAVDRAGFTLHGFEQAGNGPGE